MGRYGVLYGSFSKWMKSQSQPPKDDRDPVADALVATMEKHSTPCTLCKELEPWKILGELFKMGIRLCQANL